MGQEFQQQAKRGFASLNAEERKRIASLGGKAAHAKGTAHQFTSEEAVAAGRKRKPVVKSDQVGG